ncbi:unnamed protein product [Caenorhabditis brenneri]
MAKSMQTRRISTGWQGPTPEQKRQWKKNRKAWKAKQIAARYTAEARERRAAKRAEEAEKREAEKAAKDAK